MTRKTWRVAHELYYWGARLAEKRAHVPFPPSPHQGHGMVLDSLSHAHELACLEIRLAAVDAVVKSALALEAFINWYGRRGLGAPTFHAVDRLGIAEKWLVIPRLKTGLNYPKERQGYQDLKWLFTMRNGLVHFKTGSDLEDEPQAPFASPEDATRAVHAVPLAVRDLARIDPTLHIGWLDREVPRICEFEPLPVGELPQGGTTDA